MNPREEALRWLEEAEFDLKAARDAAQDGNYNWACFIAQQAAEKAVKAVRIQRDEDVAHIHSVAALIRGDRRRRLMPLKEMASLLSEAQELDHHYIPSRYPNSVPFGLPHEFYNQEKADLCLQYARRILQAARGLFSPT